MKLLYIQTPKVMKIALKIFTGLLLVSILFLTSCRTEEMEVINPQLDETLKPNSSVANLMQRVATNDGSNDNIVDNSNCFNIQLPFTVFVNGIEIVVDTEEDFEEIEDIFEDLDDDDDMIQIQYPITVILTNYNEVVVINDEQLIGLSNTCNGENEDDDDIECLDFVYPITAFVYNTNSEVIATVPMNNDNQLYNFIDDIGNNGNVVVVQFPIMVILYDGTTVTVNSLTELETVINDVDDECDEDDDNDYDDDDDCDDCTEMELIDIFTGCTDWSIYKLRRNATNLQDNYVGYVLNFLSDGNISITSGDGDFSGTWSVLDTGGDITLTLDIIGLPDFNDTWNLYKIEIGATETKVEFKFEIGDKLKFKSSCM